jgi:serine/threonine-protein kinase
MAPDSAPGDSRPASASSPVTFSRPYVYTCSPCGTAWTVDGADPATLKLCPRCRSPLRRLEVGTLVAEKEESHRLIPGKRFGRYVLRREVGRGGMGVVYEAHDTSLNRTVALKMLGRSGEELIPEAVERLLREARAAGKLKHPSIVSVYDVDHVDGRHYFTMDFVEGTSFDDVLRRDAPMREVPMLRRVEILVDVADALGCAHAAGVVHRDVKPSNVMIDGTGRGILLDFGLARETEGRPLTRADVAVGTPEFMSPEQAIGFSRETGSAGDVFSFGAMLFTLITGRMPFTGTEAQVLYAIVNTDPEPPSTINPDIPEDLQTICLRCLEKDPSRRFPDGASLAAELRRFLGGLPIESEPASWLTRLFRNFGRKAPPRGADPREAEAVVARARDQADALVLFEQARPVLESAWRYLYDREASHEELVRRVEAGQRAIEQGLAKAPFAAQGHYLLGRAWEIQGWDEKAEGCWREALRLEPGLAAARFHLGRLLMERAFVESLGPTEEVRARRAPAARKIARQAQSELDRAMAQGSGFEDELHRRVLEAMASFIRGELFESAELCRKGLADFPSAPGREDFWWVLGNALKGPQQVAAYDEAIRIRPRHALCRFCRGRTRVKPAELEAALDDYTEALRIKPRFTLALSNRALILMDLDRLDEALRDAEEAVRLDPTFHLALANRGVIRNARGDLEGGLRDIRSAIAADPRAPIHRILLVGVLLRMERWEQALIEATASIDLRPDVWQLWSGRGHALTELGFDRDAVSAFDEAVQREPGEGEPRVGRGRARMRLGLHREAEEDLVKGQELSPKGSFWHRMATDLLRKMGGEEPSPARH